MADLKLAKPEIAVMVRGGEGRGGERSGEGRGEEERGGERRRGEGRGVELGEGGEGRERPCTDGVSLVVHCSRHLSTIATQSPSTTGPSAARAIFMRSSL